ncbi:MAG TPA: hypothetical protein VGT44_10125 [Ktedonobacteraceae bacterium]|nr:hypothetical protein [Ktedonobacteraceae bacterium]
MKTITEQIDREAKADSATSLLPGDIKLAPRRLVWENHIPYFFLGAMVVAILLMDAVLPFRDLWFHEATLTQLGDWSVWPSSLLFRNWALMPPVPFQHVNGTPGILQSWIEFPILLGAFAVVFIAYFAALRRLPEYISWRIIYCSTILLGILYVLIPIVTSPDIYSYIAYARMGLVYNLNPLTTLPTAINADAVYNYVLWVDQPSAYGPTWTIISSLVQWAVARLGLDGVLPMVLALRLLGLAAHLISVRLVWSISGKLQQLLGHSAPYPSRARVRATLAFAWNPLLLFEACVNAHNDAILLVFILLVIWILAQSKLAASLVGKESPRTVGFVSTRRWGWGGIQPWVSAIWGWQQTWGVRLLARIPTDLRTPIAASSMMALATCLKINIVLLYPALLCYLWGQASEGRRLKCAAASIISFSGVIVCSYAPFWQGGAIFNVFSVNPSTYRAINTVASVLAYLYNSVAVWAGYPLGLSSGSPAERFLHTFSMGIFVMIYLVMLWRMVRASHKMRTLNGLIYWMAVAWLLYCAIGSPWFWPWYLVTFFGLYALLEASSEVGEQDSQQDEKKPQFPWSFPLFRTPWTARLLSFTMLSLYCFITWGPAHTFVPGLPGFLWGYLSGAWAWLLPLVGVALLAWRRKGNRKDATISNWRQEGDRKGAPLQ